MKDNKTEPVNIGARIRKARLEASLTIKKLAESAGISPTYLGMLERGEKKPSESVLGKIAKATNAPHGWLSESAADSADAPANARKAEFPVCVPADIVDIPFFLALAVQSVPDMTKEKLAGLLAVSPETIDDIIYGKGYDFAPYWGDCMSSIAKQMDISGVCQKIRNLDRFLLHKQAEKKKECLYALFGRVTRGEYPYYTPTVTNKMESGSLWNEDGVYFDRTVFWKSNNLNGCGEGWHFVFYRFYDITGGIGKYIVKDIMDTQLAYIEKTGERVTLVFESEEVLHLFEDDYSRRQTEKDALAEISPDAEPLPPISLLLVDPDTWEGAGGLIELEDANGLDGCV